MSRNIGAVRFPDGHLLYFVHDGTVDIARPTLYNTLPECSVAWDSDEIPSTPHHTLAGDDEQVEVMPYYYPGEQNEVRYESTASRLAMRITGPLSLEEVQSEFDKAHPKSAWGY